MTRLQATPPSPRRDRLSCLPNELVNVIFDLAYPYGYISCTPKVPLSKRLRPFQEQRLYRRVTLSSVRQLHALSRTLDLVPVRGELVTSIAVGELPPRNDPLQISLDDLLSKLPNLVTLHLPVGPDQHYTFSVAAMSRLSRVTSVMTCFRASGPADNPPYSPSDLASLAALPNLTDLRVGNWPHRPPGDMPRPESFRLRNVETLVVDGHGADSVSVAGLVNLCPNLVHLDLYSWMVEPDYPRLLPLLPATLRSLRLEPGPGTTPETFDSFLPRFSQLRRLTLGIGCHSQYTHNALARLTHLTALHLIGGVFHYRDLVNLVSGPSRLSNLVSITLESGDTYRKQYGGTRTPAPSDPAFSTEIVEMLDGRMTDWVYGASLAEDRKASRILVEACLSNGVCLGGTALDRFETVEDFHIEANNRAVLLATLRRPDGLFHIQQVRSEATRQGIALPSYDLDSLEPDNLEIVETALPEKNWFILSLRNKTK